MYFDVYRNNVTLNEQGVETENTTSIVAAVSATFLSEYLMSLHARKLSPQLDGAKQRLTYRQVKRNQKGKENA